MKLGLENRKQTIAAAVLGVVLLLIIAYWIVPSSSTIASSTTATASLPQSSSSGASRPAAHHTAAPVSGKKEHAPQNLDPTLHLEQLATTEQIKYEGSGRNIFIAQAEDVVIPRPLAPGATDKTAKDDPIYHPPNQGAPPPIPLKFFGFASQPGEPKRIFLSKGDDVFIAGEGEIVDRRYKVVRISPASVEIQDVVGSGPPQSVPLTQANPS